MRPIIQLQNKESLSVCILHVMRTVHSIDFMLAKEVQCLMLCNLDMQHIQTFYIKSKHRSVASWLHRLKAGLGTTSGEADVNKMEISVVKQLEEKKKQKLNVK